MSESNDAGRPSEPARKSGGVTYHKAPSMLWFVLPLIALMAYGYFSR